ncbi:NlpC/P60 family protein [Austwickia chelonae]|uniref:C40 family peptidase n=1 Tax=Austwickia chelonae TaxID=100225 RepID=UPI0013C3286D|nr:C40 family peptidase [Austwickia chelonae]
MTSPEHRVHDFSDSIPRSPGHRLRRTLSYALALACGATIALVPHAHAAPDDRATGRTGTAEAGQKVTEINAALDAADRRLDELTTKAGVAAERANAARVELQKLATEVEKAQEAEESARAEAQKAHQDVDGLAARLWMSGGSLDGLEVLLDSKGSTKVADRAAGLDLLTSYRGSVLSDAKKASDRASAAHRQAAAAKVKQEAAAARAAASATAAENELKSAKAARDEIVARQTKLLAELAAAQNSTVEAETQRRLVMQQSASRAAIEQAIRQASGANGPIPASHRGAAAALTYASRQLGKTYVWGGEGPHGYDCSGLTKMAWAQAGVRLTHQTNYQWAETARVPLNRAQPGDLIFYGKIGGDIHHVGLYLGGGRMIHAPTFGEPVKVSSIYWGDLIPFAGRVR